MSQSYSYKDQSVLSNLMDGQLIAQYVNSDVNSELYAQAKLELEKRRYRLEQIILKMNTKGKNK